MSPVTKITSRAPRASSAWCDAHAVQGAALPSLRLLQELVTRSGDVGERLGSGDAHEATGTVGDALDQPRELGLGHHVAGPELVATVEQDQLEGPPPAEAPPDRAVGRGHRVDRHHPVPGLGGVGQLGLVFGGHVPGIEVRVVGGLVVVPRRVQVGQRVEVAVPAPVVEAPGVQVGLEGAVFVGPDVVEVGLISEVHEGVEVVVRRVPEELPLERLGGGRERALGLVEVRQDGPLAHASEQGDAHRLQHVIGGGSPKAPDEPPVLEVGWLAAEHGVPIGRRRRQIVDHHLVETVAARLHALIHHDLLVGPHPQGDRRVIRHVKRDHDPMGRGVSGHRRARKAPLGLGDRLGVERGGAPGGERGDGRGGELQDGAPGEHGAHSRGWRRARPRRYSEGVRRQLGLGCQIDWVLRLYTLVSVAAGFAFRKAERTLTGAPAAEAPRTPPTASSGLRRAGRRARTRHTGRRAARLGAAS